MSFTLSRTFSFVIQPFWYAISCIVKGAKRFFIQKFKDGENNLTQGLLHELPKEEADKFLAIVAPGVGAVGLRGY